MPLDAFLAQLLRDKHGDGLSEERAAAMKAELLPRLEKFITVKTIEALSRISPGHAETFVTKMEAHEPMESVQKYVDEALPDYPAVLAATLTEFRNLYMGPQTS